MDPKAILTLQRGAASATWKVAKHFHYSEGRFDWCVGLVLLIFHYLESIIAPGIKNGRGNMETKVSW